MNIYGRLFHLKIKLAICRQQTYKLNLEPTTACLLLLDLILLLLTFFKIQEIEIYLCGLCLFIGAIVQPV